MNRRDPIISRARVVIMTPDVCHAWMTRRADRQSVREFLAKLRNIIIDEAHVYEDVFGSNAAYLFRRLAIATVNAGNPHPPQFVAATATILSPEEHMRKLTGQEFAVPEASQEVAATGKRFNESLNTAFEAQSVRILQLFPDPVLDVSWTAFPD